MRLDFIDNSEAIAADHERLIQEDAQHLRNALDAAGFAARDYDLALTGPSVPGVRKGDGPRSAHEGGWADITGNLAGSYDHEVTVSPKRHRVTLTSIARMEYAPFVNNHEGISVMPSYDSGEIHRIVEGAVEGRL